MVQVSEDPVTGKLVSQARIANCRKDLRSDHRSPHRCSIWFDDIPEISTPGYYVVSIRLSAQWVDLYRSRPGFSLRGSSLVVDAFRVVMERCEQGHETTQECVIHLAGLAQVVRTPLRGVVLLISSPSSSAYMANIRSLSIDFTVWRTRRSALPVTALFL